MKKTTVTVYYTSDKGETVESVDVDAWIVPTTGESMVVHRCVYEPLDKWWVVSHRWTGRSIFPYVGSRNNAVSAAASFFAKLTATQRQRFCDQRCPISDLIKISQKAKAYASIKRGIARDHYSARADRYPFTDA